MAPPTMHCTCKTLLSGAFTSSAMRPATLPPSFLLPAFNRSTQCSAFSTTAPDLARKDGNKMRGVSALRHTGFIRKRSPTAAEKLKEEVQKLPQPVLARSKRSTVTTDNDHGLWDFFPPGNASMATPTELNAHGRAWTLQELRRKDWNDLHRLWWVCTKEMNRIDTGEMERRRVSTQMYGAYEHQRRAETIRQTQKRIKAALTERYYAWENAREAAMQDPEINMYADLDQGETAYNPQEANDQATIPLPKTDPSRDEPRV